MTLRHRLVAVLVVLVAVGLAAFAVTSYQLYSRSQYQLVDNQLQSVSPLLTQYLYAQEPSLPPPGSGGSGGSGGFDGHGGPGVPNNLPPGSYVQERGTDGKVVGKGRKINCYRGTCPEPRLPAVLTAGTAAQGRVFTTDAVVGPGTFRVLVKRLGNSPERSGGSAGSEGSGATSTGASTAASTAASTGGETIVTAIPLTSVTRSLHRLVVLDLAVGLGVLVVLSAAGLVVVRRGLRPLERMASTATAVAAGDLSRRASPADGRSEVGRLGRAFNIMLGNIEEAFSARERTEARLRQFLADASHELRTPLTSIRGYAELYRLGAVSTPAELETVMRRIEDHAEGMGGLIEELLLLTRLDQTRVPERVTVDLAVIAAEACDTVAVGAADRQLTLDAPGAVTVVGDPAHLRQATTNLLSNAVRHTPPGTPVDISVRQGGGVALLAVADRGPGLSDDALAHVFERFWQADSSRTGAGSGLGLAIVAGIAAEHGGRATAANRAGGGAEFTLRLPVPADRLGAGTGAGTGADHGGDDGGPVGADQTRRRPRMEAGGRDGPDQ